MTQNKKCIEKEIIATKHHDDVEQNDETGKQIEHDTSLTEALKETRTHLQTDAEDE